MANAVKWIILGAVLYAVKSEQTQPDLQEWGKLCPAACSCHIGHYGDLPARRWVNQDEKNVFKHEAFNNEVYYEEDTFKENSILQNERGSLLKISMCILQNNYDARTLLPQLPNDTNALSILQSRDSTGITLEEDHMKHLQQLISLDIQGYCPQTMTDFSHQHKGFEKMVQISSEALKPITSLQYLNLQHVKFTSGNKNDIELPLTTDNSLPNTVFIDLEGTKLEQEETNKIMPKLSFQTLDQTAKELLPYNVYKEQEEHTRLSLLKGLSNLVFLRITDSDMNEIHSEMFEGLGNLEYLSLERNQLLFIPETAFKGMPNIKFLSLAHNNLLNIQDTSFLGLPELEKLDLSHNNLSHLSESSLPLFLKMKTINFKNNPIETIFAGTFERMNTTTNLFLGGNNSAMTLQPNSFAGLIKLKTLNIYNVSIDTLERQLLNGMPQLKELEMTGFITTISYDAFLNMPLLEKLILHKCQIKTISMDAFYGLNKLQFLDLSNNKLEILPPGLFDQQISLQELLLQNNKLKDLPSGFFTTLSAKMVRLEGNMWHCTCNMKDWLPAVTNVVKSLKIETCTTHYDKGVGCTPHFQNHYIYDRKVAPQCTTPVKYNGQKLHKVIRKELRCNKVTHFKYNANDYLKKRYKNKTNSLENKVPIFNATKPLNEDAMYNIHTQLDAKKFDNTDKYAQKQHIKSTPNTNKQSDDTKLMKTLWKNEMKRLHEEKIKKYLSQQKVL